MKNLKKILAVVLVAVMAMSLTGCMTNRGQVSTELVVSAEEKNPDMSLYTNDFDGITEYLADCEVIAGEGTDMSADFIGAKIGKKYSFSYEGQKATCEIYEYDLENLSDTAKTVLESVKTKGYFESLDTEVKATLSNNGKFLMIYVNTAKADNEVQQKMIARINEKFVNFQGK